MQNYSGIYRGKVLATDASETDNLGRIKCEVYPMLISSDLTNGSAAQLTADGFKTEGISITDLPWAVPAMSLFAGAGVGYGSFSVPEVGSFVWVFFEAGDIYQPVYFAEAQTKLSGIPSEVSTNYPSTKVWKSKNGIVITINDNKGTEDIKVLHPTGSYIQIDSSGNVNVVSSGNINISGTIVNINP